ncbi:MAG: glycine cleavage system protein GcvH [Gammaproteobacteria bacterium PRO9]|nr:glycine cleavage system protein GcvH [Gammaproteobacteria bacterium PRO9]
MTDVPGNLHFTKEHEWVRREPDGSVVVGITDHAQHQLGELVYVELPEAGRTLSAGDGMAVVESTKAASDVYAPLSGTVREANEALATQPDLVNTDAYGKGWLVRLALTDDGQLKDLLDAAAYRALLAAED